MRSKTLLAAVLALVLAGMSGTGCASPSVKDKEEPMAAKKTTASPSQFSQLAAADDPLIQYTGRIDFKDPKAPSFAFPGVLIQAGFEGTGVDLLLGDTGNRDFFNVSIDGQEAQVIQTARGVKTYQVGRNLGPGTHTISIFKRTEGQCGVATFAGLMLEEGKKLVALPAMPERRMEFIGDSITCGYGNMVSTDHPEKFPFTPKNENSEMSWGAQTARALGARFMSTSYSGRGMFRNLDGNESGTLPLMYGSIYPDQPKKAAWDPKSYTPDVIVINLGTNDYGSTMTKKDLDFDAFDARYAETYRAFIKTLREIHGAKVKIVCAVGPMMSDYYPQGFNSWTRIQDTVSGLVEDLNSKGDKEVYFLGLSPQSAPYGEDWHPTVATHSIMSEAAVEFIREITAW